MILFCIPHAGASAASYYQWSRLAPRSVDVQPLEIAGRGALSDVPFHSDMTTLVTALATRIKSAVAQETNFVIFGHSMGAFLAIAVAAELEKRGVAPRRVFASGRASPTYSLASPRGVSSLSDLEFVALVSRFGGMGREVLEDPEVMAYVLPILRADFLLVEQETCVELPRLTVPIIVMNGLHDPGAAGFDLASWRAVTTGEVRELRFPGDHFYLKDNTRAIVDAIVEIAIVDERRDF
jgi:surfactin synthase thioesterase subunit